MPSSTQEILERLNAAASQRGLAGPTLAAYRRIWRDTLIRAASARLDPAALPQARVEDFYAELTRGRGPSCHLQVKAALALLYRVLEAPNPFADCLAPKFRPDAVEIRHLEAEGSPRSSWSCKGIAGIISTIWSAIWPRLCSSRPAGSMSGRCSPGTGWFTTGRGG